jgi:hypothetical protein
LTHAWQVNVAASGKYFRIVLSEKIIEIFCNIGIEKAV